MPQPLLRPPSRRPAAEQGEQVQVLFRHAPGAVLRCILVAQLDDEGDQIEQHQANRQPARKLPRPDPKPQQSQPPDHEHHRQRAARGTAGRLRRRPSARVTARRAIDGPRSTGIAILGRRSRRSVRSFCANSPHRSSPRTFASHLNLFVDHLQPFDRLQSMGNIADMDKHVVRVPTVDKPKATIGVPASDNSLFLHAESERVVGDKCRSELHNEELKPSMPLR